MKFINYSFFFVLCILSLTSALPIPSKTLKKRAIITHVVTVYVKPNGKHLEPHFVPSSTLTTSLPTFLEDMNPVNPLPQTSTYPEFEQQLNLDIQDPIPQTPIPQNPISEVPDMQHNVPHVPTTPTLAPQNPIPLPTPSDDTRFQMAELINNYRKSQNRRMLERSAALDAAAKAQSEYQERKGKLTHENGNYSGGMIPRFADSGASCSGCGEIIAYSNPVLKNVLDQWINSSGHNDIMLGDYKYIGLSDFGGYWTVTFNS
ncbi:hypothetical protein BB558_006125 [Smittium angustum]|uniref:SCP domain-containing protein n=1 Tax=Smittium angustum TaxID=133377 RepID=A0A2U1IYL9_SMIAN|nr:hypothetical protein BB558_006125 [Smittium angustum]